MELKTWISENFIVLQVALSILLVFLYARTKLKKDLQSQFRMRESDRILKFERGEAAQKSGHTKAKPTPFQLSGIRVEGAPHEVLGVEPLATEAEIQKAYRDLMKRYHPDQVGRQESREWKDAQKIAEAINHARNAMLEKLSRR
jgi:DnaJ-class molecular chaperone